MLDPTGSIPVATTAHLPAVTTATTGPDTGIRAAAGGQSISQANGAVPAVQPPHAVPTTLWGKVAIHARKKINAWSAVRPDWGKARGKAADLVAIHSRKINAWSAVRPDGPGAKGDPACLAAIQDHICALDASVAALANSPNLQTAHKMLKRDVDGAQEYMNNLTTAPGWGPTAALLAGRLVVSGGQLARPLIESIRDNKSLKDSAMFIPHQALSILFAVGLAMRDTTHAPAVRDHFRKRDVVLGVQAAGRLPVFAGGAVKDFVEATPYKVALTVVSVLGAIVAMHPRETVLLANRVLRGAWEPGLKLDAALTPQERLHLETIRSHARQGYEATKAMRDEIPRRREPTNSTDMVHGRLQEQFNLAYEHSSVLLGEPVLPPENVDRAIKWLYAAITAVMTASPAPSLKGNEGALMGTMGNLGVASAEQTMTALNPHASARQSRDNVGKFGAVVTFMGPIFAMNDKLWDNIMEKDLDHMGMFAGLFTGIAYGTPGLVLEVLSVGATLGWTYLAKPSWTYVAKPAYNNIAKPAYNKTAAPLFRGVANVSAGWTKRPAASVAPAEAHPLPDRPAAPSPTAGDRPGGA